MYRCSTSSSKALIKTASSLLNFDLVSMANSHTYQDNFYSRETAFDPLNYEFDAETMIEPFTYFQDGPAESRRKTSESSSSLSSISSSTLSFPWLSSMAPSPMAASSSGISSPDESPQGYFSTILNDQFNNVIQLKHQPNVQQPQQQSIQQQHRHSKTICRHCKSHNMPECLYTSHSMYDESGALFCPVLKKCHCANCMRVTNPTTIRDDDSDDDGSARPYSIGNETSHLYGVPSRQGSYRMTNI